MPRILRKISSKLSRTEDDRGQRGSVSNKSLSAVQERPASKAIGSQHDTKPEQVVGNNFSQALTKTNNIHRSPTQKRIGRAAPSGGSSSDSDDDVEPATRAQVEFVFAQHAALIHASKEPLPEQIGAGSYAHQDESSGFWSDIKTLGLKDLKTVRNIIADKASGKPQDDRKMHMEQIIQLVAALPPGETRSGLTSAFLDELWNSLQHPPMSYRSDEWRYRSADGSNNSFQFPMIGAANTPYSRTVCPQIAQPGALPDPELIFDSILAREKFIENPNKVSSLLFNWASLVIHDLFQSDHANFGISKTSSYLDLSILYGDTQEDQNLMRTFKDGKIKPDCFAEERLLAFPPSCGVQLIFLNRFHNYIVENLAVVNEGGRFNKPHAHLTGDALRKAEAKRDNDLFQTGRLITCGLYINITLYDYLRTIINLNRSNSTWALDPRAEKKTHFDESGSPRGIGNQVSAEFNLSYRWHSCVSQFDETWTENVYKDLFDKPVENMPIHELMMGLSKHYESLPEDPQERPFAGLKRGADGKFNDDDLAKIFAVGCESVSGAFGARNIPKILKSVTILGIIQSRSWELASLNEYRAHFGLKKYDTFLELNNDPYVASQLEALYEHPDYVELYPGLAIESYKEPMVPGVGICPTYTISRIILSDAVALVRGDRFYTIDYCPAQMGGQWGFNEQLHDLNFNQGCVYHKLLLRSLPNNFKPNSIYAHHPFTVPSENAKIMKDLGRYHDYDYSTPQRIPDRVVLGSYSAVKELCNDKSKFSVLWDDAFGHIMGSAGKQFCLAGDSKYHQKQREAAGKMVYHDKWQQQIKSLYEHITLKLLHQYTVKIAKTHQVDITRDVGNIAQVYIAQDIFGLPLKTTGSKGVFTDQELWTAMCQIFAAVFYDFDPAKSMPNRAVSHKLSNMIGKLMEVDVKATINPSFAKKFFRNTPEEPSLRKHVTETVKHLAGNGMRPHDIVYSQLLPSAVAMVAKQSQAFTQVLDFYLEPSRASHWAEIQRLSRQDSADSDTKLAAYINEALRLSGIMSTYRRAEVEHTFQDGPREVKVLPGDKVFCSFVAAARDPSAFPEPNEIKLDRDPASYLHFGAGEHTCIGRDFSTVGLVSMLRVMGKLQNLRRAPGPQGQLKKVPRPGGFHLYMRPDHGSFSPFPHNLKVHFDGQLPPVTDVHAE